MADLHLGKAATYRALGQPVPAGTTRENLARLKLEAATVTAALTGSLLALSADGLTAAAINAAVTE